MDILNKEKLKKVLEKWRGHPSITGLMEKFNQLQSYTNKNYKTLIKLGANYLALSSFIWNNPRLKPEKAIKKFELK